MAFLLPGSSTGGGFEVQVGVTGVYIEGARPDAGA